MNESDLSVLGTDGGTEEEQYAFVRRGAYSEPEKALLAALLQDAIDCYYKHGSTGERTGRETLHEAERWIMNDKDDWVFSFYNVCLLLGLDPHYVRSRLQKEKRRQESLSEKHRRQAA
jgi:hypothetical protein